MPPTDPSQAFSEAWGPCLPPPPDADAAGNGPPLPWWDEARYWVHGRLALRVDDDCPHGNVVRVSRLARLGEGEFHPLIVSR